MSELNWVVLRGLARGVGHWGDFRETLPASFPEAHFEFLDIPGNGALFQETSPASIGGMVESLRQQSEAARQKKPIILLAISLGGMIATEWARRYPQEIRNMFLINTSSANDSPFYHRLRPQQYPRLMRFFTDADWRHREQSVLEMVSNSSSRREEILPEWLAESERHPMRIPNFVRQLWAAARFRFPDKAPVNTCLFASIQDQMVNCDCSVKLAQKWGCPLELHPWAGHDLPLDDADWLIECLKKVQGL